MSRGTDLSEIITLKLRQAGLEANISMIYGNIIAQYHNGITVHITGTQGPTGKTTLCKELRKFGIHAFETWELEGERIGDFNAAYIEITLNKPLF